MGLEIRKEVLRLLKEDEEFRYTVAGLIGLEELRSGLAKLLDAHAKLEEAVARLASEQRRSSRILRHLARFVDSTSITLEEEAYSIVEMRLRQRGMDVKLEALVKPYVELDIYGSDGSLTFLGETKTRLAPRHIRRLEQKIEVIRVREPELLRGRVVKTVYAMWAHPEAYEECKARNIWLNMPDRELIELEQVLSRA
jgi:hypothetical protein